MAFVPSPLTKRALQRATALLAAGLVLVLAAGPAVAAAVGPAPSAPVGSVVQRAARPACATPDALAASCFALVRTDVGGLSTKVGAVAPSGIGGYHPADLQSAYGLTTAAASLGSGITVAVVAAYDDPTAESDLMAYRSTFGLPACTTANGCFAKVNQAGVAAPLPAPDGGWSQEISLDLDMVSAVCPNCSILLVEADSASLIDLGTAVNAAVALGAKFVTNSYGRPEETNASQLDARYYKHPGVVITVSTGDNGYEGYAGGPGLTGNQYPSVSPWVVAVGGTTLSRAANARGWSESAWSGADSGCSLYEPRPAWQPAAMTGCPRRMVADVAAVADPDTGVSVVYANGWYVFGGTSASAPIVAAAYALAGAPAPGSWPASYPYGRPGLFDPVGGNNAPGGSCSPDPALWCTGVAGYDGPTGLGTPNGTLGLTPLTVPGSPTGASASPTDDAALVSWTAPASDGGSAISGFRATASPGGATCTAIPPTTSCQVGGLTNGQSYTFTVTAANAAGTGPSSAASAPVTPRTVPGAPTGVVAQPGNGSAQVSWTAPLSNGGSVISSYAVTAMPGGATCAWSSGPLECTLSGLSNGQPYTFTVVAHNAAGDGAPSNPSGVAAPNTLPDAPAAVAAVPVAPNLGELAVTWSAPPSDGGSTILGYTVTAYDAGTHTTTGRTCAWSSGPLGCHITGLAPGVPVVVRVTATTLAGIGLLSAFSTEVTPPKAPTAAVGALPSWSVSQSFSVSWAAMSGTNPTGTFDIRYRQAAWSGGLGGYVNWRTGDAGLAASFAPAAGVSYCFSARAHDVAGYTGAWSAERCTTTPLDDRSLSRMGGWTAGIGRAYYRQTSSRTTRAGATAVRTLVSARRIVLVASTCPTCGTVAVYLGSRLLRTISLASRTTASQRVFTVAAWATLHAGIVTVKVSTTGRTVIIDGLGVSRM